MSSTLYFYFFLILESDIHTLKWKSDLPPPPCAPFGASPAVLRTTGINTQPGCPCGLLGPHFPLHVPSTWPWSFEPQPAVSPWLSHLDKSPSPHRTHLARLGLVPCWSGHFLTGLSRAWVNCHRSCLEPSGSHCRLSHPFTQARVSLRPVSPAGPRPPTEQGVAELRAQLGARCAGQEHREQRAWVVIRTES